MSSSKTVPDRVAPGKNGRFEHAYAIIRLDEFALPGSSLENCITVTAIMLDTEAAEREVERLNKQAAEGVRYVWQTARFLRASSEDVLQVQRNRQMSDDRTKRGPQDSKRINVDEDYELRYWSHSLNVSPETLKQTVEKVGVMADDVRRELSKQ